MKTYKYIALAVLTLGFTACSQDNDIAQQQEGIVKIASASIATELQTRVNTLDDGTAWETGDQILLVNNSCSDKNSGTYTYNGTSWDLTDGVVLYALSGTNDFTAYYPASADFTVPYVQLSETEIKSADRMIATTTGVAEGEAVALSFERKNAKVTIKPTLNTEFDSNASISELQIGISGGIIPYHPKNAADYTAIIAPVTNGFTVTVKVDIEGTEHELEATTSTAIEAGKHYTFNLTVGKEAVNLTSISVNKWTEKNITEVDTQKETFVYDPAKNTYTVNTPEGLQDAIDAATGTGISITLMADVEVSGGIPNDNGYVKSNIIVDSDNITIDLNGHTIKSLDNNVVISVENNANLTVNDSSEEKKGKIVSNSKPIQVTGGTLTINNGNYEGGNSAITGEDSGTIVINGGVFKGTNYAAIDVKNTSITITGGEFNSDNIALIVDASGVICDIKGGSFTGGKYDLHITKKECLKYDDVTYVGPSFPGGISSQSYTLNQLLGSDAGYYINDERQEIDSNATSLDGDVVVKRIDE